MRTRTTAEFVANYGMPVPTRERPESSTRQRGVDYWHEARYVSEDDRTVTIEVERASAWKGDGWSPRTLVLEKVE